MSKTLTISTTERDRTTGAVISQRGSKDLEDRKSRGGLRVSEEPIASQCNYNSSLPMLHKLNDDLFPQVFLRFSLKVMSSAIGTGIISVTQNRISEPVGIIATTGV